MDNNAATPLITLALVWLGYFILHSVFAARRTKCWVKKILPGFIPLYRLTFNVMSVLLLIPPLWLIHRYPGPLVWNWPGAWGLCANVLAILAMAGFVYSLRYYDMRHFIGVRQIQDQASSVDHGERLCLSPLHRWVRHPWYFLLLVVLWTRDWSAAWLVSSLCISGYLYVGSWLEERKLLQRFGPAYRQYRQRVPMLIPRPWRYLRADEAAQYLRQASRSATSSSV